ncbi:MAG: L-histidine N(alpha)-methyltransferase [Actinophytocola sp.]|nr:L-histidine N(alpha)-methyltransferase [Actinophytocola sp.]
MNVSVEVHLTDGYLADSLRADVRAGLTATPKSLPPKWFYDAAGSLLFERITDLPEYYPTRTEREILAARAAEIAELTQAATLIELGSGSSEKTRRLIDALRGGGSLREFVPLDVSETALRDAAGTLAQEFPGLQVHGVVGDFFEHLDRIASAGPRMVAFLGSTIGNLLPGERVRFLRDVRAILEPGDWLLLGTDLVKRPEILQRAYDDAEGVTAEFNRNVLRVLNRELCADFDVDAFEHVAVWDAEREWIEMRLRATRQMWVKVPELGLVVPFARGEEMRTEVSAKFRPDIVEAELAAAGFDRKRWWTDDAGLFGVALAEVHA